MEDVIHCPKCNSTQITANKKGFSGGKAVAGAVLTGGIGILAGTIGSKKVIITCLNCGKQFNPGEVKNEITTQNNPQWKTLPVDYTERKAQNKKSAKVLWPIFGVASIILYAVGSYIIGSVLLLMVLCFLIMAFSKT